MENTSPINIGNAEIIQEKCYPMIRLVMLRYESIFDYYSEEPASIFVKLDKDGKKYDFEQILRIRRWTNNKKAYSWCIYSQEREFLKDEYGNLSVKTNTLSNLIIRNVVWNMELDYQKIKDSSQDCREDLINNWPSIQTKNIYLDLKTSQNLIKQIYIFDKEVENGITFSSKTNPEWCWRDLEIKRLFNWGQIHATWSPIKESREVENFITKIEENLEEYLTIKYANIYSIDLDFTVDPLIYKDSIFGTEKLKL